MDEFGNDAEKDETVDTVSVSASEIIDVNFILIAGGHFAHYIILRNACTKKDRECFF